MAYNLLWSPADSGQITIEFTNLLNNGFTSSDAVQLGLELRRVAQSTTVPPPDPPRVHSLVYPASGTCAAYYAFDSKGKLDMYVLGFCEVKDLSPFYATARGRLNNVP